MEKPISLLVMVGGVAVDPLAVKTITNRRVTGSAEEENETIHTSDRFTVIDTGDVELFAEDVTVEEARAIINRAREPFMGGR